LIDEIKGELVWCVSASEMLVTADSHYFVRCTFTKPYPSGCCQLQTVSWTWLRQLGYGNNRLLNLLQFVEATSLFYPARIRWSSHLAPIANANLGPFVQILNIIGGQFLMSSSFCQDFNKQRGVVAGRQILLNNPEYLKAKRFER